MYTYKVILQVTEADWLNSEHSASLSCREPHVGATGTRIANAETAL